MMIVILYICAFLVSLSLTGFLYRYGQNIIKLDVPNERSSHVRPTPRGGGLSIVVTYLLAGMCLGLSGIVSWQLLTAIFIPVVPVAFIGLADDIWGTGPLIRLAVHFICAVLFLYLSNTFWTPQSSSGGNVFSAVGYVLVIVSLVWCINLNNFMDGIDGIAGVEAVSVTAGAALILWLNAGDVSFVILMVLLASCVLGFLWWNWPPAKIFMGDACSGFLGLLIGILAFLTSRSEVISIWSWLILYGVFVVDATYTLLMRVLGGARFYEAHRSHSYQILSRRLQSHKKVSLGVLFINMLWLFPLAIVSSLYPEYGMLCLGIAYCSLVIIAVRVGAGTTNE